jgi:hypothetical protein
VLVFDVVRTPGVVFPPVPDWLVSGATTVKLTLFSLRSAVTSALIPSPFTPSSLETRMWIGAGAFAALALAAGSAASALIKAIAKNVLLGNI